MVDQHAGEPVAGIVVIVEGTAVYAISDQAGRFVLDSVPPGPVVLVAEGPTITPCRVPVGEKPVLIRVASAILPEYAVVVTAPRRRPVTASATHVTPRELAAAPRRTAEDALRLVPGLTLVQHGSEGKGHQFFLRGFDAIHGADLEITVAGIPINEHSNIHAQGYLDLGFVIPEVIASVDVTKGPFRLEQGAFAMAGSAAYELGVPDDDRGARVSYTVGTTNRHRLVATYTPREGDGHDFVAAEALHDSGFGQQRQIRRSTLLGSYRLVNSPTAGTVTLLGAAYVAAFQLPGTLRQDDLQAGRVAFADAYDHDGEGLSGRSLVALQYRVRRRSHVVQALAYAGYRHLDLLESYTGFLGDPVNGDRRAQEHQAWSFGGHLRHQVALHPTLTLQTGLEIRGDLLDQHRDHVDQQAELLERTQDLTGIQGIASLLAGFCWRPMRPLRLTAGVRGEAVSFSVRDGLTDESRDSGTLTGVLPRLAAEWHVLSAWRLFAAYGRGFRPPEARSFTSFVPSRVGVSEDRAAGTQPRLTVADSLEVGTRVVPSRYLGANLSLFATFIERESIYDHVAGVNLELNSTRRLGAEVTLTSRPLGWLTLSADGTLVDARFVESGRRIPGAPWLTGGLRAVATHPCGLHGGLRFLGLAPRPLPHGARGQALVLLDATAGYRWRWLRIDLELENLLDREIREGEYHYASHWRPGEPISELPVLHYVAGPPFGARLTLTAVF